MTASAGTDIDDQSRVRSGASTRSGSSSACRCWPRRSSLPVEHPDAVRVRRATAAIFKTAKERRRRERRDAILAADAAVTAATATGAPDRLDDETRGIPLSTRAEAPVAGFLQQAARLLHLQAALPPGGRLLPPALPGLRRAQPQPPGRPHRPDRPAGAAHRRPREDRHVHRAAAAARRRAHHDHHAVPARRGAPLHGHAGQRGLVAPAAGGRHRSARPGAGGGAGRLGRRGRAAGHSDQQRRPDGTPLARLLLRPGRRRVGRAACRAAARAGISGWPRRLFARTPGCS